MVDFNALSGLVEITQRQCSTGFGTDVTVAVSSEDSFINAAVLYREVKDIIKFEFYLGEGRIITKNDVNVPKPDDAPPADIQADELSAAIRSGNISQVQSILDCIFNSFCRNRYDINKIRAFGIELYIAVIKQCEDCEINVWIKNITKINECSTVAEIRQFILDTAVKLARKRYELVVSNQNRVIEKVIRYIHQNIDDDNLSLQLIASKILYLNVDYLGKLFKKETGMRFSYYLFKSRMEKAKELIKAASDNIKIYEIAKATGFSNNPSYFTQMFKKYTGTLPKEYRQGES
jgi:two-component system response regulator YesN